MSDIHPRGWKRSSLSLDRMSIQGEVIHFANLLCPLDTDKSHDRKNNIRSEQPGPCLPSSKCLHRP
eukprot:4890857-Amphidinium_carterae.1